MPADLGSTTHTAGSVSRAFGRLIDDAMESPPANGRAAPSLRVPFVDGSTPAFSECQVGRRRRRLMLVKRLFDVLASVVLLIVLAPVFGVIAFLVAMSGAPVVYRHQRIGRGGVLFRCLKFRTMVPDSDRVLAAHLAADPGAGHEWRGARKLKADPRVTRFGAWLRRSSLDELPQLINVVRGEMSLVGPRPITVDELARYGVGAAYYLESTPGITGLWQVSGRNDLDFRRRVQLDCWYVRNWSLWHDVVILMKTPRVVILGAGAY